MLQTPTTRETHGICATRDSRVDLRRFGLDARLFSRRSSYRSYDKLAFIGTSKLRYSDMEALLCKLFCADVTSFPISRIDFAVDVPNLPVDWFHRHLFASRKRFSCEYGVSNGETTRIETMYLGKRPNCIRVYSKGTKKNAPAAILSLTRVERQCGGSGVPASLNTFGRLQHAVDFDPFCGLRTVLSGVPACSGERRSLVQTLAGIGYQTLVHDRGAQQATTFLNRASQGNAARIRRALGIQTESLHQTLPELQGLFRESVRRQVEA